MVSERVAGARAGGYGGGMRFEIVKCHGSGNDFAMIDARAIDLADEIWAQVARALADRRGAVGGDGLLLLSAGDKVHAFGMRMFNPDGSESETCLNGLRCVARAGFEALGIERACVRLMSSSVEVAADAQLARGVCTIRETAGPATLDVTRWPLHGMGHEIVETALPMLPGGRAFTAVAMPNPHLVSFVETIDDGELTAIGAVCEGAPAWLPHRANVSFVELRGPQALFVRTFERGAGLTDSCGSAMAASSFAACLTGRTCFGTELTVFNRGGLVRAQAESDGMVRLSGNATYDWLGSIDVSDGAASDLRVAQAFDDERAAWDAARGR